MMESKSLYKLLLSVLVITITLTLLSFIGDLIIDTNRALKSTEYLGFYFFDFLLFHSWMFFVAVIIYSVIFKKVKEGSGLLLKSIFAAVVGIGLSQLLYKDEASMTTYYKFLKVNLCYSFSGLIAVLVIELFVLKQFKVSNKPLHDS